MASLTLQLPAPAPKHLPVLDELKGLAILLVVLYHAGGVLSWQNFLHGDVGVDIFVIGSGIGLALSGRYTDARSFLTRRLARIFPAYWIALTAYWALNTCFLQHHYSAINLLVHYAGLHGLLGDFYAMSINDSFWFITLIAGLYLLYCALQPLVARPDRLLLVGGVISVILAFVYFFWGQAAIFGHLTLRLPGFFLGLVLGALLRHGRLELNLSAQLGLAGFIFAYVPYTRGIVFHTAVVGAAVMGSYTFGLRPHLPSAAASRIQAILAFFSRYSLEIFLLHQPLIRDYVVYVYGRFLGVSQPSVSQLIVGMACGFALTLVLSVELNRLLRRLPFATKQGSPA